MEHCSIVLIKPHVFYDFANPVAVIADVQRTYVNKLFLTIRQTNFLQMTETVCRDFYAVHLGKPFFPDIVKEMTSGPCYAIEVCSHLPNVIDMVRNMNGATNPAQACAGTLRHKYGRHEQGPHNGLHASDSLQSARQERFVLDIKPIIPAPITTNA